MRYGNAIQMANCFWVKIKRFTVPCIVSYAYVRSGGDMSKLLVESKPVGTNYPNTPYNVLDLFCGAGGLSEGFRQAGYNVVAGIDNDKEALITFSNNHPESEAVLADLGGEIDFEKEPFKKLANKKIDVIIGGPPCQGFSVAGNRIADDPRNILYKSYLKMIKHFRPKVIVLENVPTIMSLYGGKIGNAIISDFKELGYNTEIKLLVASDYGIPQKRRRVFFIAFYGQKLNLFINKTKTKVTTAEAISDLPLLEVEEGAEESEYTKAPETTYQREMRKDSKMLYNHWAVKHKPETKRIISLVPDGGNYKNLPKNLQNTRKVHIAWTRMNSKAPCFTIDAGHNHHFHYKANRVPTVRECARIQSFPDKFRFYGKKTSQFRQVGNAVPPMLSKIIAVQIKIGLNGLQSG